MTFFILGFRLYTKALITYINIEGEVIIITCDRNFPTFNGNSENNTRRNCILDILKKIDQSQKEAVIETEFIGCGGGLITKAFDTKPVVLTLDDDAKFTAYLGVSTTTTDLFRVEEVNNECVLLRALERTGGMIRCTRFTCTLLIGCICGIQCLEPINCHVSQNLKNNFTD